MSARAVLNIGSREVARVIYGAIIGLALVVALEDHPPAAGVVAATIVVTGLVVALAELYSEAVGTETHTRHRLTRPEMRVIYSDAADVAFGAAFPAVFFVLAALGAMSTDTAFTVAKWTGLGLIALFGFSAARLRDETVPRSLLHALAVGSIAGIVILLKALLH